MFENLIDEATATVDPVLAGRPDNGKYGIPRHFPTADELKKPDMHYTHCKNSEKLAKGYKGYAHGEQYKRKVRYNGKMRERSSFTVNNPFRPNLIDPTEQYSGDAYQYRGASETNKMNDWVIAKQTGNLRGG